MIILLFLSDKEMSNNFTLEIIRLNKLSAKLFVVSKIKIMDNTLLHAHWGCIKRKYKISVQMLKVYLLMLLFFYSINSHKNIKDKKIFLQVCVWCIKYNIHNKTNIPVSFPVIFIRAVISKKIVFLKKNYKSIQRAYIESFFVNFPSVDASIFRCENNYNLYFLEYLFTDRLFKY